MNLVDAYVTKILSEPKYIECDSLVDGRKLSWWQVDVEYDCYGRLSERPLTFDTEEKAKAVKVGHKFLT